MEEMIKEGYRSAETLRRRIEACRAWLADPKLLERDPHAEYKEVLEIDLGAVTEPIVACPNDPDDVKPLSAVSGDKVQEVFIGSCMTNIGQFRAAAHILDKAGTPAARIWLTPPTKMDAAQLMREGFYSIFIGFGGRTEMPGCSLCMGNQARVAAGTTVFSTSTRNFEHRMGDNTRVYLGSSELAALTALLGRIPTVDEYMTVMKEKVLPKAGQIYRYLEFHKMGDFSLGYVR
jgi:aconitate hydratase 2/2-methylisocitrate dehydratase